VCVHIYTVGTAHSSIATLWLLGASREVGWTTTAGQLVKGFRKAVGESVGPCPLLEYYLELKVIGASWEARVGDLVACSVGNALGTNRISAVGNAEGVRICIMPGANKTYFSRSALPIIIVYCIQQHNFAQKAVPYCVLAVSLE
jgi:hypothetical protein